MGATVGAALKKIAVALLSDPKVLKTIVGVVLGIFLIIILPIAAAVTIFNEDIAIDADRLEQEVVQNLSVAEEEELQFVEDTMVVIENAMTAYGFDAQRAKEAQVLYVLALSAYAHEAGFVSKLAGCFAPGQSDADLIDQVNTTFGADLSAEDFSKVMNTIRSVYISTSGYVDPATKNNLDLAEWAKNAYTQGWGYVWGTFGTVLSRSFYNAKLEQYPDEVGRYADFILSHWLGGRTVDCVGLIKGYGWLDPNTHQVEYGTNGMPDIDADAMYENATEKGTIDTIPDIPGLAVWQEGHIGIYIGGGEVVEAMGTQYGVVKTQLAGRSWTHWLKIPYITYLEDNVTSAPNESRIWQTLKAKIGNSYGTAALMGNLFAESGLQPNNLQNSYEDSLGYTDASYTQAVDSAAYGNFATDSAGYGLAQWTVESRKAPLLAYAREQGKSVGDLDLQLTFLCHELETKFPGVLEKLQKATSIMEASDYVLVHFENPADQSESVRVKRASYGSMYYGRYGQNK